MVIRDFGNAGDHYLATKVQEIITALNSGEFTGTIGPAGPAGPPGPAGPVYSTIAEGPGIDPTGATASTTAIQILVNLGGELFFPTGTYVIDSVLINSSIRIVCGPGVTFKRANGADGSASSYWVPGAAMFEINSPGLTVEFSKFTYDGNNANQTVVEPTGFFLKTYPTSTITTAPTIVRIVGGKFINGTSGYLCLRGDDNRLRYKTYVLIDKCEFYDTVYGRGRDDPGTPTALGYHPTYVHVYDDVTLRAYDFSAVFDKPISTGLYGPCALNATYYGSDFNSSGEAHIYLHGTTYLRGMGRSGKSWNDDNIWSVNNGIGAIDCYGNAEELLIDHVVAEGTYNVPVRAKASLRRCSVETAVFTNCHRGIQVGPSSTGPDESAIHIGKVYSYGGTAPQVEVTGSTTTSRVPNVSIDAVYLSGPMTMPENNTGEGGVHLRNIWNASVQAVEVNDAPWRAITATDVDHLDLNGVVIDGAGQQGIQVTNGSYVSIDGFDIKNTAAEGIVVTNVTGVIHIGDGRTNNTVNYGVYQNSPSAKFTHIHDAYAENVTGTGRGFYVRGGDGLLSRNGVGAGVATAWLKHADVLIREEHNTWNPSESWGTAAPTGTTVTYLRGSKVWNTSAASAGPVGWVCTAAGAPGTWVGFGVIS